MEPSINLSKSFIFELYLGIIQKPKRTRFTIKKVYDSLIIDF